MKLKGKLLNGQILEYYHVKMMRYYPIAGKEYTYTAVGLPAGGAWRVLGNKRSLNFNYSADLASPVFNTGNCSGGN